MTDFDKIYVMYFHDVFLYIYKLSGDAHLAEDLTSETFFKALGAIDDFRGDCDVRVWLCKIAKNCYLNNQKKHGRISSIEEIDPRIFADEGSSLEERSLLKDDVLRIQKILHNIPEPNKEIFMWRVFGELSFKQIGLIFGKSENWACVTYHRTKKMIKKRLEENET